MEDLIKRSDAINAIASLHILADEEKIFKVYADNPHSMTTDFEGTLIDAINAIKSIPTIEPKAKVVAQVTFNEEKLREIVKEAVERFKEEYEITDRPQGEWIFRREFVEDTPTIDIVRCKDCKYWVSDGGALMICDIHKDPTVPDHYCSYGEEDKDE